MLLKNSEDITIFTIEINVKNSFNLILYEKISHEDNNQNGVHVKKIVLTILIINVW